MPESSRALLRWQFDLTWALFEHHLERLEPADFLWEPAEHCWTVRRDANGDLVPDWADTEPDPVPVPTIAWLTWHIGWWWTVAVDHLRGRTVRQRTDVAWPGAGGPTVAWLRGLRTEWLDVLDGLTDADLDRTAPFPWQDDSGHTVTHMVAWANAELMKNVAEIGQLRLLRAAAPRA
ncbi:DinB superfamily protein [Micromonospora citrea]|uniref:DinB superfamily protein n=1 Tax=Micromonospora citrea TaxID=47855 RepID=A0A1C6U4J6_9ACTN|nr:DinB family protein [Micromonospora citrea]SCL48962.1 DinB superfamily protein [Micromonospora citrea]